MTESEKTVQRKEGDASVTREECTVCEDSYDPEQTIPGYFLTTSDGSKGKFSQF